MEQKYDGNKYVSEWYWVIGNEKSTIKTAPPKKIK